jgi:hypothetical protein
MSEGNGRLRKAMELQDDKATYLAIQVSNMLQHPPVANPLMNMKSTVRDLVHQVRLDLRVEYRQQPAKDLGDLFKMVGGELLSQLLLTSLPGTPPSALLATLSKRLGNG